MTDTGPARSSPARPGALRLGRVDQQRCRDTGRSVATTKAGVTRLAGGEQRRENHHDCGRPKRETGRYVVCQCSSRWCLPRRLRNRMDGKAAPARFTSRTRLSPSAAVRFGVTPCRGSGRDCSARLRPRQDPADERHRKLGWFRCPAEVGRRAGRDEADVRRQGDDDARSRVDQQEGGATDDVAGVTSDRADRAVTDRPRSRIRSRWARRRASAAS